VRDRSDGNTKRFQFVSHLRAFGDYGQPNGIVAPNAISSDSLSSRTTVVTPSFALSSVCLAYAPTVTDFP